jgi:hypothetical protein
MNMQADDTGLADQAIILTVGAVGTIAAGAPMFVLAVSEEAARNAQFSAAVFAAILGFGAILAWFARTGIKIMRKLDDLDSVGKEVRELRTFAEGIGKKQVTLDRYEADRKSDRAEAAAIFATAEANRRAAEESGVSGLTPLPFRDD